MLEQQHHNKVKISTGSHYSPFTFLFIHHHTVSFPSVLVHYHCWFHPPAPSKHTVTKRKTGVKVEMSGQKNTDLSYDFPADKMLFFYEASTRAVKLKYCIVRVTRPHKWHKKYHAFTQKMSVTPHGIIFFLVFLVCSSRISKQYVKYLHKPLLSNSVFNGILNTKGRLPYLKTQFVPRSKYFSSRL